MGSDEKIFLDAREMEHPVPLERAIGALRQLDETNYFYMIHRKNPIPLIELAQGQGFKVCSRQNDDGIWHIVVTRSEKLDPEALCNV